MCSIYFRITFKLALQDQTSNLFLNTILIRWHSHVHYYSPWKLCEKSGHEGACDLSISRTFHLVSTPYFSSSAPPCNSQKPSSSPPLILTIMYIFHTPWFPLHRALTLLFSHFINFLLHRVYPGLFSRHPAPFTWDFGWGNMMDNRGMPHHHHAMWMK